MTNDTAVRGTGGQPWETLWPPGWLAGLSWQPVIAAGAQSTVTNHDG